eukprot:c17489_g1_i1 orf=554-751(-)
MTGPPSSVLEIAHCSCLAVFLPGIECLLIFGLVGACQEAMSMALKAEPTDVRKFIMAEVRRQGLI